jgi:hypothetical protein
LRELRTLEGYSELIMIPKNELQIMWNETSEEVLLIWFSASSEIGTILHKFPFIFDGKIESKP